MINVQRLASQVDDLLQPCTVIIIQQGHRRENPEDKFLPLQSKPYDILTLCKLVVICIENFFFQGLLNDGTNDASPCREVFPMD